jgi:hypothetical protein
VTCVQQSLHGNDGSDQAFNALLLPLIRQCRMEQKALTCWSLEQPAIQRGTSESSAAAQTASSSSLRARAGGKMTSAKRI